MVFANRLSTRTRAVQYTRRPLTRRNPWVNDGEIRTVYIYIYIHTFFFQCNESWLLYTRYVAAVSA